MCPNPSPVDVDSPTSSPSPSPSPSPSADPSPTNPFFTPTRSQETPEGLETAPPGLPSSGSLDGAASGDGADPGTSSAPRSTGSNFRARLRELKKTATAAVLTAGGVAHQLLTREGSPERDAGLWLPDEDDVEAISDPLAGLASRRVPSGAENPDITDLIRLAMGVVSYVVKQRAKAAGIQRDFEWEPDGDEPRREPEDV